MNSDETLVMPGSEPAHVRLVFTPDNVRNTTITLGNSGVTLYTVRSARDYSSTAVIDPKGDEVAKIKYRSLLPDLITLRGAEKKLKDWLPERKRFPVTMNASNGTQYIYKADPQRRIALYCEDDQQNPLAWYSKKTADLPAHLALTPTAENIQVEVVCAFLILRAEVAASHAASVNAQSLAQLEASTPQIDVGASGLHMPIVR